MTGLLKQSKLNVEIALRRNLTHGGCQSILLLSKLTAARLTELDSITTPKAGVETWF
jgi:hypothetical protein